MHDIITIKYHNFTCMITKTLISPCYYLLIVFFLCYETYGQDQLSVLSTEARHGEGHDSFLPKLTITQDGGFITTISTSSSTGNINTPNCSSLNQRIVWTKYTPDGTNIVWEKCFAASSDSAYLYLLPTTNNNFLLGGTSKSNNTWFDFIVRKEDTQGNIIWGGKKYGSSGSDLFRNMIATKDGGCILIGESNSSDGDVGFHYGSQFSMDIWVLKLDKDGDIEWSTVLGGTADDMATTVLETSGEDIYIIGTSFSNDNDCLNNHGYNDIFIAKLNKKGNKIWSKLIGGSDRDGDYVTGRILDDTSLVIAFSTSSSDGDINNHIGGVDIAILKIDSNGSIFFNRTYGSVQGQENPIFITESNNKHLWVAGTSNTKSSPVLNSFGKPDGWVLHIDPNGTYVNSVVIGSSEHDECNIIHELNNNIIFVGGYYSALGSTNSNLPNSHLGNRDIFINKIATWTTSINNEMGSNMPNINVFPNPTSSNITVSVNSTSEFKLELLDITGRALISTNIQTIKKLSLDHLSSGVYILKLNNNKKQYTSRILKLK